MAHDRNSFPENGVSWPASHDPEHCLGGHCAGHGARVGARGGTGDDGRHGLLPAGPAGDARLHEGLSAHRAVHGEVLLAADADLTASGAHRRHRGADRRAHRT